MAVKNKITEAKIDLLVPDDLNANKGTQYGQHLVEESLRKFGAGRSILLDKNNRIISGDKTIENAGAIGLEDVLIIESTGNQIIAVKRTDIDLNTRQGREMAIADNASAKADISWDYEVIGRIEEQWPDVDISDWGIYFPDNSAVNIDDKEGRNGMQRKVSGAQLIIQHKETAKLSALYSELNSKGFQCELKE